MDVMSLMATLGIDTSKFEDGIKKAKSEAEDMSGVLEDVGESADDASGSLGEIANQSDYSAVVGGLSGITSTLKSIISAAGQAAKALIGAGVDASGWADDLITESQQYGLDQETIQRMRYASRFVDTNVGTIEGSMQRLTRNMYNAQQGSDEAAEAFENLGITYKNADGTLRPTMDTFWDIVDALHNVDNQAERDGMAMQLLGRNIAELGPLVQAGSEAYRGFMREAPIVAGENVEQLGVLNDAWQDMTARIDVAKMELLSGLAPALTEAFGSISDYIGSDRGIATIEKLGAAFENLISTLTSGDTIDSILNVITTGIEAFSNAVQWLAEHSDAVIGAITGIMGALGIGKVAQGAINIGQVFTGLKGLFGGAGAAGANATGGGILGGIGKDVGSFLGGAGGATAGFLGATFAGFVGMDAYATNRDYGDLNSGLANMQERISALESKGDEQSTAYADAISSLGGLLDTLNEGGKTTFEGDEWNQLSAAVEAAQALLSDRSDESEAKFAEIQSLIDEMINDPNAGANEELISSLGTLLSDLETQSQEQVAQMTEDVNNAATASLEELGTTAAHTIEVIGTDLGSSIEGGVSSGAASMSSTLASEGAAAAESIASAIQSALNKVHLPSFSLPDFGGRTQKNARAMNTGRIFTRPTIFGYADGAYQMAGDAGAEAVVGVNSLDSMIQKAVSNAMAGVLGKMDELRAGQGRDMQLVLDSGELVGGIANQMNRRLGSISRWREGGHA